MIPRLHLDYDKEEDYKTQSSWSDYKVKERQTMNADDARKLVIENQLNRSNGIYELIRNAASNGMCDVCITSGISPPTIAYLKENGYKVDDVSGDYSFKLKISW